MLIFLPLLYSITYCTTVVLLYSYSCVQCPVIPYVYCICNAMNLPKIGPKRRKPKNENKLYKNSHISYTLPIFGFFDSRLQFLGSTVYFPFKEAPASISSWDCCFVPRQANVRTSPQFGCLDFSYCYTGIQSHLCSPQLGSV